MSVMRDFMRITETFQAPNSQLLYHWTTLAKTITALRTNRLQARRWAHYLEGEHRMARGTSWSSDQWQWSRDNPVCFVANKSAFTNSIHPINGNRTFLQTKGMVDPLYDPNAYKLESTEPDEEFVEGTVDPFSAVLVQILTRSLAIPDLDQIREYASIRGVPLVPTNA